MTDPASDRVARVEALLLEMKDTSELMLDLGYTSVFYHSERIAREVIALEETVGNQLTELQRTSLEAVKAGELDIDHAMVLIRVAQAAEVIANSAQEIADVVLRDVELHPVMAEAIQASDSAITKVELAGESAFAGKTVGELALESETGMRITAVRRRRWHTGIDGEFLLKANDLIVATGPPESVAAFLEACNPQQA